MHDKVIPLIEKLIAVCQDGAQGFDLAAAGVNSSVLQAVFRGYSRQRSRFSGDLQAAAAALGKNAPAEAAHPADPSRRPRRKENRAGNGRNESAVISERERQERAAMSAYATALAAPELPAALRVLIAAQAAHVKAAHREIHDLCSRFAEAKCLR